MREIRTMESNPKAILDVLVARVIPMLAESEDYETGMKLALALGREEFARFKAAYGDVMGPLKVGDVVFVSYPFHSPSPFDYHVYWGTVVRMTKKYFDIRHMMDEQTWPSDELMHTKPLNAWCWMKHAERIMIDEPTDLKKREFWSKMKPKGLPPMLVMRTTKEDFVSGRVLEATRTRS